MFAITLIGNRTCGEDYSKDHWGINSHILGCSIMTLGLWDIHHYTLWAIPAIFLVLLFFRAWHDGAWLDETTGKSYLKALIRSAFIFPLGWLLAYLNLSCTPIYMASGAIFLIPLIYWVSGLQNKVNSVELAECLTGALIGAIS